VFPSPIDGRKVQLLAPLSTYHLIYALNVHVAILGKRWTSRSTLGRSNQIAIAISLDDSDVERCHLNVLNSIKPIHLAYRASLAHD